MLYAFTISVHFDDGITDHLAIERRGKRPCSDPAKEHGNDQPASERHMLDGIAWCSAISGRPTGKRTFPASRCAHAGVSWNALGRGRKRSLAGRHRGARPPIWRGRASAAVGAVTAKKFEAAGQAQPFG